MLKFFLNPECTSYLRELSAEFNESTNAIRLELNRFEEAGMLDTMLNGNRKIFRANKNHPLYLDIRNILLKYIGIDQIIEKVIKKLGNPEKVYLTGEFAKGRDGKIIDLIIVGDINKGFLIKCIETVESQIDKKIRYIVYRTEEFNSMSLYRKNVMLLWSN